MDPQTIVEVKRVLAENGRFVILPLAQLTGRGPIHRLIELAFRITGQRQGFSEQYSVASEQWQVASEQQRLGLLGQALVAGGFVVRQHLVELPGSVALVIVARLNSRLGNQRITIS
jgi:hypothetical protein